MFKKIATGIVCATTALSICACGQPQTITETQSQESEPFIDELLGENNVEVITTVEFEDYESGETLAKSIQNGEMDGQIIVIDGVSKKIGSGYSIGQQGDDSFIGTTYVISDDMEYPGDGSHVTLKGVVKADGLVHYIEAYEIILEE